VNEPKQKLFNHPNCRYPSSSAFLVMIWRRVSVSMMLLPLSVALVDKGRLFWVCRCRSPNLLAASDAQRLAKKEDEDFNLQRQHEAETFLAFAFALAHTSANVPQHPSLKLRPNQFHPPFISVSPYLRAIVGKVQVRHSPANAWSITALVRLPFGFHHIHQPH